jgi:curved DNA-binding protein CbpA
MSAQTKQKPKPMAQGNFSATPFPHVLIYIYRGKLGGTLEVRDSDRRVIVYFRKGMPAKVRSNVPARNLGLVLRQMKVVDEEQLRICEQEVEENGGYMGQLLLDLGHIDVNQLVTGLKEQMLLKLRDLFSMPDAKYAFYKSINSLVGYGPDELLPIDPYALLMSGLREHGINKYSAGVCNTFRGKWLSAEDPDSLKRFRLTEEEKWLFDDLLEKPWGFEDLLDSGRHDPRVIQYGLYAMTLSKLLIVDDAPPSDPDLAPAEDRISQLDSVGPAPPTSYDPPTEAKRTQLLEKAAEMPSQNYYQMLGVTNDASVGDVRKAFFRLSKQYHPDKIPKVLHRELKEAIQFVFSNLSEAHMTLLNNDARTTYDTAVKKGVHLSSAPPVDEEETIVRNAIAADQNYQKALICIKRADFDQAHALISEARELDPEQQEYTIVWAFLESKKRPSQAPVGDLIEQLSTALEDNPMSEKGNLYLAQMYKQQGDLEKAKNHFEEVLEINSRNIDAARELRMLTLKKPQRKTASSLLGRLMGSKTSINPAKKSSKKNSKRPSKKPSRF